MSGTVALSDEDIQDTRRYCGYPVEGALPWRRLYEQGNSAVVDQVIASLTATQITTLQTVYLVNLRVLEAAVPNTTSNLDTAEAAVWKRNPLELQERMNLLAFWQRKLCFFLGVPGGAGIAPLAPAVFVV